MEYCIRGQYAWKISNSWSKHICHININLDIYNDHLYNILFISQACCLMDRARGTNYPLKPAWKILSAEMNRLAKMACNFTCYLVFHGLLNYVENIRVIILYKWPLLHALVDLIITGIYHQFSINKLIDRKLRLTELFIGLITAAV